MPAEHAQVVVTEDFCRYCRITRKGDVVGGKSVAENVVPQFYFCESPRSFSGANPRVDVNVSSVGGIVGNHCSVVEFVPLQPGPERFGDSFDHSRPADFANLRTDPNSFFPDMNVFPILSGSIRRGGDLQTRPAQMQASRPSLLFGGTYERLQNLGSA